MRPHRGRPMGVRAAVDASPNAHLAARSIRSLRRLAYAMALVLAVGIGPAFGAEAPYDAATFQKLLLGGAPLAVDFYADWCPICRAQAPLLRAIVAEPPFHDLTLLIANFDTEPTLRRSLNVSQQSTIIVFRHGKEVARSTGDTSRVGLTHLLHAAIE